MCLAMQLAHVRHGDEVAGVRSGCRRTWGRGRRGGLRGRAGAAGADLRGGLSFDERQDVLLVIRPPRPVPEIWESLTPCSRAILRTRGMNGPHPGRSSSSGGGGRNSRWWGRYLLFFFLLRMASRRAGRRGLVTGPGRFAIHRNRADDSVTPTVVPSVTLISARTPEAGAGISASTLSAVDRREARHAGPCRRASSATW